MAFPIHEVTDDAESPVRPPSTSPSLTSSCATPQTNTTLITFVQPSNDAPIRPPILPPTPPLPNPNDQHQNDTEPAAVYLLDALFTTSSSAFPFLTESTTSSDVNATPLFVEIRKAGFVGLTNKVVPSFFGAGGSTNANRRIEAKWKAGWPIPISADRFTSPSAVPQQQGEATNDNALVRVCVKTIGALGSEKILATQSLNLEAFFAQASGRKFQCRLQFGSQGSLLLTFKSTFPLQPSSQQQGRPSATYSPRLSTGNPLWGHSLDRTPRTSGASPRPSTASRPTSVITKRARIPSLLARIFSPLRPSAPCHFPRNAVTAVDHNQSGNSSSGSASHLPLAKTTSASA